MVGESQGMNRLLEGIMFVAAPWRALMGWFWSFLPDKCQIPGCCRKGVRGNESVILMATITDKRGRSIKIQNLVICDYCHSLFIRWDGAVIMTQKVGAVIEEPDAIVKVHNE